VPGLCLVALGQQLAETPMKTVARGRKIPRTYA
jgi:hypothetical protein